MRPKEGRPQVAACPTLGIQLKKMSFVQSFVFAGDGLLYTSELCLEWQASEAGTALKEACGQTGKSQQRSFVEMWGWIVSRLKSSTKRLRNILIPNWKKKTVRCSNFKSKFKDFISQRLSSSFALSGLFPVCPRDSVSRLQCRWRG